MSCLIIILHTFDLSIPYRSYRILIFFISNSSSFRLILIDINIISSQPRIQTETHLFSKDSTFLVISWDLLVSSNPNDLRTADMTLCYLFSHHVQGQWTENVDTKKVYCMYMCTFFLFKPLTRKDSKSDFCQNIWLSYSWCLNKILHCMQIRKTKAFTDIVVCENSPVCGHISQGTGTSPSAIQ